MWEAPSYVLASGSSRGLSLGLALPSACGFLHQTLHILGISHFQGHLLQFWLQSRDFTHCPHPGCLQGLQSCHTLPGFSCFLLMLLWKASVIPQLLHSAQLQNQEHVDDTKIYSQLDQYLVPLVSDYSSLRMP